MHNSRLFGGGSGGRAVCVEFCAIRESTRAGVWVPRRDGNDKSEWVMKEVVEGCEGGKGKSPDLLLNRDEAAGVEIAPRTIARPSSSSHMVQFRSTNCSRPIPHEFTVFFMISQCRNQRRVLDEG